MTTRILLADDHAIIRAGLRSLLESQADFEVIGEATTGREAVEMAGIHMPDVIIMDVGMPELNGIDATKRALDAAPEAKVIGLSMHSAGQFVNRMLEAGAAGYLLKDCAFDELTATIRRVLDGETVVGSSIPQTARTTGKATEKSTKRSGPSLTDLTQRERGVLQLLAEGKTSKDIAGICSISIKTVDTHRQHIKKKLNLGNLAELTKFAIREGLTSVDD